MIVSKHANVFADISGTVDRMHGPKAELRRHRIVHAYKKDLRRVLAYYEAAKADRLRKNRHHASSIAPSWKQQLKRKNNLKKVGKHVFYSKI